MRVYVIYDRLAEEAGPLYEAKTDAVAVREYRRFLEKLQAGRDSEFWLFCIGEYQSETMSLVGHGPQRIEVGAPTLEKAGEV